MSGTDKKVWSRRIYLLSYASGCELWSTNFEQVLRNITIWQYSLITRFLNQFSSFCEEKKGYNAIRPYTSRWNDAMTEPYSTYTSYKPNRTRHHYNFERRGAVKKWASVWNRCEVGRPTSRKKTFPGKNHDYEDDTTFVHNNSNEPRLVVIFYTRNYHSSPHQWIVVQLFVTLDNREAAQEYSLISFR